MFNLFSGKKKDNNGFYLELDESKSSQPEEAPKSEPVTVAAAPVEEAPKSEPVTVATAPVEEAPKSEPVAVAAAPAEAPNSKSVKTTSVKKTSTQWEQPEWVKAINNYSNNSSVETEEQELFATKYLVPIPTNMRRTPGPSMNKFRQMASKTRR